MARPLKRAGKPAAAPPRPSYAPPTPIRRGRKSSALKVAWLTDHAGAYFTLRMAGFERDDLDYVKASTAMRYDSAAHEWIIHRNDVRWVREALDELGFITREGRLDDDDD